MDTQPQTDDDAYLTDGDDNDDLNEELVDFRGSGGGKGSKKLNGESYGEDDTDESDSEVDEDGENIDFNERQEDEYIDFMKYYPIEVKSLRSFVPDEMVPGKFIYISNIIITHLF